MGEEEEYKGGVRFFIMVSLIGRKQNTASGKMMILVWGMLIKVLQSVCITGGNVTWKVRVTDVDLVYLWICWVEEWWGINILIIIIYRISLTIT